MNKFRPIVVVLPSFTGRSIGLGPLVQALAPASVMLLELPETGEQSFSALNQALAAQLPKDDCVLVAESFSSPLALMLAARAPQIKGVIFAGGFLQLSPKARYPLYLHPQLPARVDSFFSARKLRRWVINDLPTPLATPLIDAIALMPQPLFTARRAALGELPLALPRIHQPCLVLNGQTDLQIDRPLLSDLSALASQIQVQTLACNHYVLQAQPVAAAAIHSFSDSLSESDTH